MKTIVASLFVVVAALAAPAVLACGGHAAQTTASSTDKAAPAQKSATVEPVNETKEAKDEGFKLVSVDDVQKGLDGAKAKKPAPYAVFDANGPETRAASGIIPTAVLLPSASEYDVALLPKDKASAVVFYCANEKCTASHTAAKRAVTAGHTNVAVLGAGIKGWVDAGKSVAKPVG
jgi:rhodanese-related sulfurtransferase